MGLRMTAPAPSTSVKVPALGPVKKTYLYVGGAALAGIVFFAYISRGRDNTAVGVDPDTTSLPDASLPTQTTTTIPDNTDVISTNSVWTQRAVEFLSGVGVDPQYAAVTLGKYLSKQAMTSAEQAIALAARAAFGEPPVGGPYPIYSTPVAVPAATTPLATPQLHVQPPVGKVSVKIAWTPVPNTSGYRLYNNGKHVASQAGTVRTVARRSGIWAVVAVPKTGSQFTPSHESNHVKIV
jgi:hypothetical protein